METNTQIWKGIGRSLKFLWFSFGYNGAFGYNGEFMCCYTLLDATMLLMQALKLTTHFIYKKTVFPYICVTALIFVAPLDIIICKYICSIIIIIIIVAFVTGQGSFFQEMEQFLPILRRICLHVCPSVSDRAASVMSFSCVLCKYYRYGSCNIVTTFMIRHSESYGRFEKAHFSRR